VTVSALSVSFYDVGGEIVAVPGMVLADLTSIILLLPRDVYNGGLVHTWMYLNVVFYTVVSYFILLTVSALRNEKSREAEITNNEVRSQHMLMRLTLLLCMVVILFPGSKVRAQQSLDAKPDSAKVQQRITTIIRETLKRGEMTLPDGH
jgi:hypothetical protein